MRNFFDTLAVFTAQLLRLEPVSWATAREAAASMRAAYEAFKPATVMVGNEEVAVAPPETPLQMLLDATVNAMAVVVGVWIVSIAVQSFFALLPYLAILAAVLLLVSWLVPNKAEPQAA